MNKPFFLFLFSVLALLSSCHTQDDDATSLNQRQEQRPSVAIAPLIDTSGSGLNWDLSDEITYTLSSRLAQKTKLNIADPQRTKSQIRKVKANSNPFGSDLTWMKTAFPGEEFVVFLELFEHQERLNNGGDSKAPEFSAAHLDLSIRLRIVDIRSSEPSIILQEIIQDSHFIPRQFTSHNFTQSPWNSEEFNITPVGIAHSLLVKELSSRIEDYVSLAKNKGL